MNSYTLVLHTNKEDFRNLLSKGNYKKYSKTDIYYLKKSYYLKKEILLQDKKEDDIIQYYRIDPKTEVRKEITKEEYQKLININKNLKDNVIFKIKGENWLSKNNNILLGSLDILNKNTILYFALTSKKEDMDNELFSETSFEIYKDKPLIDIIKEKYYVNG